MATPPNTTMRTVVAIGIMVILVLFVAKWLFLPGIPGAEAKTIQSTGTSESRVDPDLADVYLRIEVLKPTAEEAAAASKESSNAVVAVLKTFQDANVETTSYTIYKREDYTEKGPVFKGYVASYSLKASTTDFDDVGKMIDAAVDAGATGVDSVQFTLSKDAEERIRGEVLKKASENARSKAEAVADGLGVRLGKVVSVSEGNVYIPPIFYEKAVMAVAEGQRAADLQIEPQSLQISATVSVTYEIKN